MLLTGAGVLFSWRLARDKKLAPDPILSEVVRKLAIALPDTFPDPGAYSISLNYLLEDGCVSCVLDYFRQRLSKEQWLVQEKKLDDMFAQIYQGYKKPLSSAGNDTQASIPGMDERIAERIRNSDEALILEQIKTMAPMVLFATRKSDGLKFVISVRSIPAAKQSEVTINIQGSKPQVIK